MLMMKLDIVDTKVRTSMQNENLAMIELTEILCLKLQIICVGPSCRPWSLGKQCDKIVLPTNFMNSRTVYRTCTYRMGPTHSAFSINDNKFHPFSSKL